MDEKTRRTLFNIEAHLQALVFLKLLETRHDRFKDSNSANKIEKTINNLIYSYIEKPN